MRMLSNHEDNFRLVHVTENLVVPKRDFVVPTEIDVGSYVAIVFKVTGFNRDCDGSAMLNLEQVDRFGEESSWTESNLGISPDSIIVLDSPDELWNKCEQ